MVYCFSDLLSELLLRQAVGHVDAAQQAAGGVVFRKPRLCKENKSNQRSTNRHHIRRCGSGLYVKQLPLTYLLIPCVQYVYLSCICGGTWFPPQQSPEGWVSWLQQRSKDDPGGMCTKFAPLPYTCIYTKKCCFHWPDSKQVSVRAFNLLQFIRGFVYSLPLDAFDQQ